MPGWEQRVRDVLASANAPEAFTFLAAFEVEAVLKTVRQRAVKGQSVLGGVCSSS